jgi:hypothetical protein
MDNVYHKMVRQALSWIVLAPKGESSLQERARKVLICYFPFHARDFPDDVKKDWRKIESVYKARVNQRRYWEDPTTAKAHALTAKQARLVLQSFLNIANAVTKRQGQKRDPRSTPSTYTTAAG